MKVRSRLLGAVAAGMAAIFVFVSPAHAGTGWYKSVTGAAGWVSYSRSAQTYTVSYSVKDTRYDGDCAYVVFRPQIYQSVLGIDTWTSVGWSGYEYKDTVCGYGEIDSSVARINVWDKMTSIDRLRASRMRLYIRVCRDVDWWSDSCSGFTTPSVPH
ncbi:MAG: hypothetical protein H0T91_05370 [Propionibacteriaceae bacterium]|nr:hypothetical protein [Propionibacteriaceae bacterium]